MDHKLKEALNGIHAEDALKEKTKAFLTEKTHGYQRRPGSAHGPLVPAMACLLLVLLCLAGCWLYFTPTSVISIDVNPSLELGVNRFDRVISVQGYNEDGRALAEALDVRFMNYADALDQILSSEGLAAYLSQDEILSICVIGADGGQGERLYTGIEAHTAGHANTYCYHADTEEVAAAHGAGLSYGKYRAFLEVLALDPSITLADIQEMTMGEIHHLHEALSGCGDPQNGYSGSEDAHGCQHGKHGH